MILQPITPTALHPNPIHMVKACLPCACAFLKNYQIKSYIGKYPKSSNNVNIGKISPWWQHY